MSADEIKRFEYLSISGNSLLLPLFAVVSKLLKVAHESVPAKANSRETAWSLSAIAIAAMMLESFLLRAQWDLYEKTIKFWSQRLFYASLRQQHENLPDINELFVIRDIVFHNHLYRVTGTYAPTAEFIEAEKIYGGDSLFERSVDMSRYVTVELGMNIIPTRITRVDVSKFLQRMVEALEDLVTAGLLMPQIIDEHEAFEARGRPCTLREVTNELKGSVVPTVLT